MKVLHLNVKKKWFDMIETGVKKEEYREISPYWCSRFLVVLTNGSYQKRPLYWWRSLILSHNSEHIVRLFNDGLVLFKRMPDKVVFSNGYAKDRPQIIKQLTGISIYTGYTAWGAEDRKLYFVLTLKDMT